MTYSAAIDYLYGLQKHGIKLGLETMRTLLGRIGHPERRFRTLHVGGTNGKGSTAGMAAAILQAAGLRVGLYTSPHLVDFRERIRVDGKLISEESVAELTGRLQNVFPAIPPPTFFEMTTAMALLHFSEAGVDVAVIEVGLGGRCDATNVIEPMAAAITTIGLDHEEYLGDTLESIAFEKAGIIKPSVPVIRGRVGREAGGVISRIAQERRAPLWRLREEFAVDGVGPERFTYRGAGWTFENLQCGLAGRHQLDNAACALALLEASRELVCCVDEGAVRRGLQTATWEGRLERIEVHPDVLLDGAHNPAAAEALAAYLQGYLFRSPDSRIILVWGMMRDKDHRGFIKPLSPLVSEIVLTEASLSRSATVKELHESVLDWTGPISEVPNSAEAVLVAKTLARSVDLICVTGSLMLLGDVKAALRGCELSPIRG